MDMTSTSESGGGRISLVVASPIYNDQCYGSYAASLMKLQEAMLRRGHEFIFQWTKNVSLITQARNVLANWFMHSTKATHLLFVDSDMAFDAADVMRMFEYDHDLLAAIYPRKELNWENIASAARQHPEMPIEDLPLIAGSFGTFNLLPDRLQIPTDHPFPIANAGTGLMLIRRNVFVKMAEAYPDLLVRMNERASPFFPGQDYMHAPFETMITSDGRLLSEDIAFCERWRAVGGEVHGCAWFNIRHLGTYEYASDVRAMARAGLVIR
jgi:hypothetical protein